MKLLKHSKSIAALLLFMLFSAASVQAQQQPQSDYSIVHNFNTRYEQISDSLEMVTSAENAQKLVSEASALNQQYSQNSDLLSKVLYPETYSDHMRKLQNRANATYSRLQVIEEQNQKLSQLNQQVSNYAAQLNELNRKTDSLSTAMRRESTNSQRKSSLISRYRESLQQRDAFIQSMIDTLFQTYKSMNADSLKAMEENARKKMGTSGDLIAFLQSVAKQNISFLNNHPDLNTDELLRMYSIQAEFSDLWNKLGDKIASIYAERGNQNQVKTEVGNTIDNWHTQVAGATFKSITATFSEAGIDLPQFTEGAGFYNSLNTYLDDAIKASRENATNAQYQKFQKFSAIWNNTVKPDWAEYLVKGHILTYDNISTIDQKVTQWGQLAQPRSYAMFIYLGIAVLIIIILAILLYRSNASTSTKT